MKVFISYSRKDAEFVNKLKESLEASDIGVIIDVESLKFGDNLQEFVERSVRGTDLTIAVISKHSLQSVWVVAEALETLMYEHVEGRKRFLPIYIDTSFQNDSLYLKIIKQIDADIAKLQDLTNQAVEQHLGTALYDTKRQRFINLRNNLDNILKKLADVLVADFSSGEKSAKNLPKLIEAIKRAEKERERYTGRPSAYLAPFQAPPLPQHFVPRPEVTDTLKARLLKDGTTTPGILVISAIHGLGGIGKSTLAAALAYDKEVQERFPDGILWATLGQQPEILSLISGWIQAMRDYDFRPTTIEAASAHLRTLLQDKAVLLVVDDVWNPEHAIYFKVGGPCCQVLITTRRADVADEVGAELHQMDVMTPEQSLDLLAARLQRSLDAAERGEALSLAEVVGYLPLALELVAVRVARGMSWKVLCEALEQEAANLNALEGSPRRRRKGATTLEACFKLSLNALRSDDEEAWQAFVWLGVLPEDVQIAAPMAATLWEMGQTEASDLLELLWNDALLLPGSPVIVGKSEWPAYRPHDLLHDIARKLLTTPSPQGLGLNLKEAHVILLERYMQSTQNGLWHTLPDDGYIHAHLTWHFQQAGQEEQIHTLLREETEEGRNGWCQAREHLDQTAGFLEDVNLAWTLAESAQDIGLQCRYAMMIASFNSLVQNIPNTLLIALVEHGIWSPAKGLAYACQISAPKERADVLVKLSPYLPRTLRQSALQDALTAAQAIEYEGDRAKALTRLAPHLPDALYTSVLQDALKATQTIESERERAEALTRLAPHLPDALYTSVLQDALKAAQTIEPERERAEALTRLAPHLPDALYTSVLQDALKAAQTIESERERAEALTGLAPHLSDALLEDGLAIAQAIEDGEYRAQALTGLAPHLPDALLREALTMAQAIEDGEYRAQALTGLASYLSDAVRTTVLQDALAAAQAIEDEGPRARALTGLAPHLPDALLREALAAAQAIEHEGPRARALTGLAPHLPDVLLREALTMAQAIEDGKHRAGVLTGLAPHLPDELLKDVLTATQAIESELRRTWRLIALAPHLPEALWMSTLQEALTAAQAIKNEFSQTRALTELAPYLPEALRQPVLEDALRAALAIKSLFLGLESRAEALTGLVPWLIELPAAKLLSKWHDLLVRLAQRSRKDLLSDLRALTPVIAKLGGYKAIVELFHAIQDVGRWWP